MNLLSQHYTNEFMASIGFKSSSIQHDVHFVNYGTIESKIDHAEQSMKIECV